MKQQGNKWFLVAIVLLIGLIFGLGYYGQKTSKERNEYQTKSVELQSQFTTLMTDYEGLKKENIDYAEKLRQKDSTINASASEIQRLLSRNRQTEKNYNNLKKKYSELEKEFTNYKQTVEALRAENERLRAENSDISSSLQAEKENSSQLQSQNEELNGKVQLASILNARDIQTTPMREKCSKKLSATKHASKVKQVQFAMQIDENRVAQIGAKTVYVRVYTPANKILVIEGQPTNFTTQDGTFEYTAKQDFDYSGNARQLKIMWTKPSTMQLVKGFYRISVYCEGHEIGKSKFELK